MVGKKDMMKNGKKKKKKKKTGMIHGMKAVGPMIKAGMMAIGPQKNCTTSMSMVISRRKEKERKAIKARMMRGKGGKPGDGKGKSNYVQPQTSSTPAIQNQQQQQRQQQQQQQQAHYSTAASSSGHGFVSFAEADPARVDVLTANYEEQEYHRLTRRGGHHQRDAVAQQHREASKRFPVLVGEVGALRQRFQRRPAPVPREVGLQHGEASWKPLEKGT